MKCLIEFLEWGLSIRKQMASAFLHFCRICMIHLWVYGQKIIQTCEPKANISDLLAQSTFSLQILQTVSSFGSYF